VFAQDEVIEITIAEDNTNLMENNLSHDDVYLTNALSVTVAVINENNKVVDTVTVGDVRVWVTYNPGK
jgi:type IV secretory pathway ATPase VirB11/archaellum biosynthesis ATPase